MNANPAEDRLDTAPPDPETARRREEAAAARREGTKWLERSMSRPAVERMLARIDQRDRGELTLAENKALDRELGRAELIGNARDLQKNNPAAFRAWMDDLKRRDPNAQALEDHLDRAVYLRDTDESRNAAGAVLERATTREAADAKRELDHNLAALMPSEGERASFARDLETLHELKPAERRETLSRLESLHADSNTLDRLKDHTANHGQQLSTDMWITHGAEQDTYRQDAFRLAGGGATQKPVGEVLDAYRASQETMAGGPDAMTPNQRARLLGHVSSGLAEQEKEFREKTKPLREENGPIKWHTNEQLQAFAKERAQFEYLARGAASDPGATKAALAQAERMQQRLANFPESVNNRVRELKKAASDGVIGNIKADVKTTEGIIQNKGWLTKEAVERKKQAETKWLPELEAKKAAYEATLKTRGSTQAQRDAKLDDYTDSARRIQREMDASNTEERKNLDNAIQNLDTAIKVTKVVRDGTIVVGAMMIPGAQGVGIGTGLAAVGTLAAMKTGTQLASGEVNADAKSITLSLTKNTAHVGLDAAGGAAFTKLGSAAFKARGIVQNARLMGAAGSVSTAMGTGHRLIDGEVREAFDYRNTGVDFVMGGATFGAGSKIPVHNARPLVRNTINGTVAAASGAGTQLVSNAVHGRPLTDHVGTAAAMSGGGAIATGIGYNRARATPDPAKGPPQPEVLQPAGRHEAHVEAQPSGRVIVKKPDGTTTRYDGYTVENGERFYLTAGDKNRVTFQSASDPTKTFSRVQLPILMESNKNGLYNIDRYGFKPGAREAALVFQPEPALDHNGAFQAPYQKTTIQPGQLIGNDGRPLADLNNVAVFRGHGAKNEFAGLTTEQAAKMVAEEIHAANRNRPRGQPIEYVALDSCSQGDKRFGFIGRTNAQSFQRHLDANLQKLGSPRVSVLASDRPGVTYGSNHLVDGRMDPVRYVPAERQHADFVPKQAPVRRGGVPPPLPPTSAAHPGATAAPEVRLAHAEAELTTALGRAKGEVTRADGEVARTLADKLKAQADVRTLKTAMDAEEARVKGTDAFKAAAPADKKKMIDAIPDALGYRPKADAYVDAMKANQQATNAANDAKARATAIDAELKRTQQLIAAAKRAPLRAPELARSQFEPTVDHLMSVPNRVTPSDGFNGAHMKADFDRLASTHRATIVSKRTVPGLAGVEVIQYQIPGSKKLHAKTVFDANAGWTRERLLDFASDHFRGENAFPNATPGSVWHKRAADVQVDFGGGPVPLRGYYENGVLSTLVIYP